MDKADLRKMLGMSDGETGVFYKLNKVTMSGDDGSFTHTDLLSKREKGEKPNKKDLGKKINGIILKMRWVLELWDERGKTYYSSTEYDDKWTDQVTVYPPKEKGSVEDMKAKYSLKTLRVLYVFLPESKEIVRLMVKASALSGKDKNENGELGLFEYIAELTNDDLLPCHVITTFQGTFRNGKNEDGTPNKRKDHYAMYFTRGAVLDETRQTKIYEMMEDVDVKTKTKPATAIEEPIETEDSYDETDNPSSPSFGIDPKDDINPDDIPF